MKQLMINTINANGVERSAMPHPTNGLHTTYRSLEVEHGYIAALVDCGTKKLAYLDRLGRVGIELRVAAEEQIALVDGDLRQHHQQHWRNAMELRESTRTHRFPNAMGK